MAETGKPTASMVAQAAEWAALLDDGAATPAQRAACEDWCRADPLHRLAFERISGLQHGFERLDAGQRETLQLALRRRADARPLALARRAALAVLLLAGAGGATLLLPPGGAERTATLAGERRELALADGSGLFLDSATQVELDLSARERRVVLAGGRLLASVAPDTARPFVVETADGTVTALGTAFVVSREAGATLVTVTHSRVRVCAAGPDPACRALGEGERARLAGGQVRPLTPVPPAQAVAWTKGWLLADDMPLADALAELNRQRMEPIRYEATRLAGLRVTGSFPLDDAPRTLAAFASVTGIQVRRAADGALMVLPPG